MKEVVPSSRTKQLGGDQDFGMFPDVHQPLFSGVALKITLTKERSLPDFP